MESPSSISQEFSVKAGAAAAEPTSGALDARSGWLLAALVSLLLSSYLAFTQAPDPDPWRSRAALSADWWRYPLEQNAFRRLPRITAPVNDLVRVPGTDTVLIAVGQGGLIARSEDGGDSWQRIEFAEPTEPARAAALPSLPLISRAQAAAPPARPESEYPQEKNVAPLPPAGLTVEDQADTSAQADDSRQDQVQETMPESESDAMPLALTQLQAVFFVSAEEGWIVGDQGLLLHSRDGGRQWQRQPVPTDRSLNALYFADPQRGWLVGDQGTVLATRDGGNSWRSQFLGDAAAIYGLSFIDPDTGWLVGEGGALYYTRDGGAEWEPWREISYSDAIDVHFYDAQNGLALSVDGGLWRSRDGGGDWQAVAGLGDVAAFCVVSADEIWVLSRAGELLQSRDGGSRWTLQASGLTQQAQALRVADDGKAWLASAGGSLLRSQDGGVNWQLQALGTDFNLRDIDAIDAHSAWVSGSNGVILRTRDGGASWHYLGVGATTNLVGVDFVNPLTGWAIGGDGAVFYSVDAGDSWQPQKSGSDNLLALSALDEKTAWLAGDGQLFYTRDAGNAWQARRFELSNGSLLKLNFSDANQGWTTDFGQLYRTGDGGNSWQPAEHELLYVDARTGWVDKTSGQLFKRSADGKGFNSLSPFDGGRLFTALQFVDSQSGWLVGRGGEIFHTDNGGANWRLQRPGGGGELYTLRFADTRTGWAAGLSGTLLFTRDGGQTWAEPAYLRSPAPWYYLSWLVTLALLAPALRRPQDQALAEKSIADVMASDSPLQPGDDDPLGFNAIARSLSRFIRNENTRPPLTIAITGPWGSGKSSLMNLLSGDLKHIGFRPVWFNVWHHQKEEHLLAALLANIRRQAVPPLLSARPPFINVDGLSFRYHLLLQRGPRHWLLWLATLLVLAISAPFAVQSLQSGASPLRALEALSQSGLQDILGGITGNLDLVAFGTALLTALGALYKAVTAFGISPAKLMASIDARNDNSGKLESRLSFRYHFAQEFRDVTQALEPLTMVIMIDDLDRCRSDRVLEILEAVNFLVSSGRCIVVLGMDYDIVRQSIALEYRDLAEALKSEQPDNGASKGELFAAEYLEKLINIQVPVPVLEAGGAGRVLASKPPALSPWQSLCRRWRARLQLLLPYAAVLAILALGWWWGQALLVGSTSATGAQAAPASQITQEATEPATERPAAEARTPQDSEVSRTAAEVMAGDRRVSPWYLHAGLPMALLLVALLLVLVRPRNIVVKDSDEFTQALHQWAGVVLARRNTPRTIKRFLNRTRYFAMRLRDEREAETPVRTSLLQRLWQRFGRPRQQQADSVPAQPLNEALLVAMSAIHHYDPALIQTGLVDLGNPAPRDSTLVAIQKLIRQSGQWPPDARQLQEFRELAKGIEVH